MVVAPLLAAAVPLVLGESLQARGGPLQRPFQRAPGLKPGDILRAALDIQALSEAGKVPRVSTDPFTGNLVVSTEQQIPGLFNLLGERFAREALASTPAESAAIFAAREEFIESRRVLPVFPTGVDPPTDDLRQQVIAPLVRESPAVIAPGVVSSVRPAAMTRRLGGPCAGVTTGFQRLNCARGGIS